MQIKSMGIDLGKTTFHLVALGNHSQAAIRKEFSRQQLLAYAANLPSCLIGMEAGVGSHFLGRALREQGHEVRLFGRFCWSVASAFGRGQPVYASRCWRFWRMPMRN